MIDTNLRFGVYKHTLVQSNGTFIVRQFIVLRNQVGAIVLWTDFHKYTGSGKKSMVKNIYSDDGMRPYMAVKLLNYVFFDRYHIKKLTDIRADMVKEFLNDYGLCRLPDDKEGMSRNKAVVSRCVAHTIDFLEAMTRENPGCRLKIGDLYSTTEIFSKRQRKFVKKKVPIFDVNYRPNENPIFRDITEEAFQIIMNEIAVNHTRLLMLAALSAFAGLRPSEACNVRRTDSVLGPGIRFEELNGEVVNAIIDLRHEYNLRSDLKVVGRIKKERQQKVYPAFLHAFMDCYNIYMKYMEGRPYERDYGALTVTSTGKAYCYESYRKAFHDAVNECIPIMLQSDDPRTVNYGMLLQEHSISPHILRHWFSVKLTIYGVTHAELMSWRGDKSPESALTYINNKSELIKQLNDVSDAIFDYSMWKADKKIGKTRK